MDVAGDLQIDCFTVYELACRLQYVYSFYVPTLTSPRVVQPGVSTGARQGRLVADTLCAGCCSL